MDPTLGAIVSQTRPAEVDAVEAVLLGAQLGRPASAATRDGYWRALAEAAVEAAEKARAVVEAEMARHRRLARYVSHETARRVKPNEILLDELQAARGGEPAKDAAVAVYLAARELEPPAFICVNGERIALSDEQAANVAMLLQSAQCPVCGSKLDGMKGSRCSSSACPTNLMTMTSVGLPPVERRAGTRAPWRCKRRDA
jgi:hypothetical protein